MSRLARSLVVFVVVGSVSVVLVGLLTGNPESDRRYSVPVSLAVLGAVALVQLVAELARLNPGSASRVQPLVAPAGAAARAETRVAALTEWEAALLTALTGGRRGRARLAARIEPLVAARVERTWGLATDDPRAAGLTEALDELVARERGSRDATLDALEVLLDQLEAEAPYDLAASPTRKAEV